MEHPSLGSLRDYLEQLAAKQSNLRPLTLSGSTPTPCLVKNVERRGNVDTNPDPSKGRPYGLYGNNFQSAPVEAVKKATTPLVPPTISNIIAIAAPNQGDGEYKRHEITNILSTAYTGFVAARRESERGAIGSPSEACGGEDVAVTVHTGNWGTGNQFFLFVNFIAIYKTDQMILGAFGGNKVLMSLLQLVAAEMAGIDRLVFHSPGGGNHFAEAEKIWKAMRLTQKQKKENDLLTEDFITLVHGMRFRWGVGDGN